MGFLSGPAALPHQSNENDDEMFIPDLPQTPQCTFDLTDCDIASDGNRCHPPVQLTVDPPITTGSMDADTTSTASELRFLANRIHADKH